MKWKKWRKRKRHRYWRHLFKEQIRKAGWVLFEAKINEELIDQNRQRVFELSAMQGIRPFL
ncbi:MAG: hypothetical protein CME70_15565 [Halobacteriovorax sp.]|nr:hypothetical protein [Halobacteriovorax sp.]|tara:strand:+ start:18178 stop:18360 length:183 start_codon:yes stop_codon:yes gene_type:complete